MTTKYYEIVRFTYGFAHVRASDLGIQSIDLAGVFSQHTPQRPLPRDWKERIEKILAGYDVQSPPLDIQVGTEFQRLVWSELVKVPWGEKITYKALAEKISKPKAVRAVGTACGNNPIAVLIPCHRVVPKGPDHLIGDFFKWGIFFKRALIDIEQPYYHLI